MSTFPPNPAAATFEDLPAVSRAQLKRQLKAAQKRIAEIERELVILRAEYATARRIADMATAER